MPTNQPKTLKSELKEFDMKKHYVRRSIYESTIVATAPCSEIVSTLPSHKHSTWRKNHVTCKNCRKTKIFRGIKAR